MPDLQYGYRMSKVAVNMAGVTLAGDLKKSPGAFVALIHPGVVSPFPHPLLPLFALLFPCFDVSVCLLLADTILFMYAHVEIYHIRGSRGVRS